jgi:hypothetical protein
VRSEIKGFLRLLTWVDLRGGLDDSEGIDRLIWGITGTRPDWSIEENQTIKYHKTDHITSTFTIITPKNGDLIFASSKVFGVGPPETEVFLCCRMREDDSFVNHTSTYTDKSGRWSCPFGNLEFYTMRPGAYELYASGGLNGPADPGISQPVSVYYRDEFPITQGLNRLFDSGRQIKIISNVHSAYIQGTQLREGRVICKVQKNGSIADLQRIAAETSSEISQVLSNLIPSEPLRVRVDIDESNRITIDPKSSTILYYAFPVAEAEKPYGSIPSTDLQLLRNMVFTQLSWHIDSVGGELPKNPFAERTFGGTIRATSEYLEIRHLGFKPGFTPLHEALPYHFELKLTPVLNKRIAVLSFPSLAGSLAYPAISQIIVHAIVESLEGCPPLATYGYLSKDAVDSLRWPFGHSAIELGNEILTLNDIDLVRRQLQEVNTSMVSGEGRHMRRRELDIHFSIRGEYEIL